MRIQVRYGIPGHEREYVVHIEGFGWNNYIPDSVSDAVAKDFPFASVMNRGSRIEVMTDDDSLTSDIEATVLFKLHNSPWIKEMADERHNW